MNALTVYQTSHVAQRVFVKCVEWSHCRSTGQQKSPPRGHSRSIHPHYLSVYASTSDFGETRLIRSLQHSIPGLWLSSYPAGFHPLVIKPFPVRTSTALLAGVGCHLRSEDSTPRSVLVRSSRRRSLWYCSSVSDAPASRTLPSLLTEAKPRARGPRNRTEPATRSTGPKTPPSHAGGERRSTIAELFDHCMRPQLRVAGETSPRGLPSSEGTRRLDLHHQARDLGLELAEPAIAVAVVAL